MYYKQKTSRTFIKQTNKQPHSHNNSATPFLPSLKGKRETYFLVVKRDLPDVSEMSEEQGGMSFHSLAPLGVVGVSGIPSNALTLE